VKDQTSNVDELFATTVSRRKMLKMSSLLGLGVAGGWLLAACGDDDDDDTPAQPGTTPAPADDDDDEDDETPEPTDDDDEETPEPDDDDDDDEEPAPSPGDTSLTVGLGTEPIEMDPHRLTANIDRQIQRSVFSGLTRWDLDMDPQPDLALSWEISDDQITWTFDLREGVLFHNGREMTAEDVKFSYERIFEIGAGGKYATYIREIESVEVVDDYTVELTLAHPSGVLLTNL
jgi:ABC-type transport system substrate-binding protein